MHITQFYIPLKDEVHQYDLFENISRTNKTSPRTAD